MAFLALLFALFGGALAAIGGTMLWRRLVTKLRAQRLTGTIVEWGRISVKGPHGAPTWQGSARKVKFQPVVRFIDASGTDRTLQLDYQYTRAYRMAHKAGSPHELYHDVRHPDRAYDTALTPMYLFPSLFVLSGVLVLSIGLGMFFGAP